MPSLSAQLSILVVIAGAHVLKRAPNPPIRDRVYRFRFQEVVFMPRTVLVTAGSLVAVALLLVIAGCSGSNAESPAANASNSAEVPSDGVVGTSASQDEEHVHKAGVHGGTIVSLGRDSYHVEAIVTETGELRLYTLGSDETRVMDVEIQDLVGYVKESGGSDSTPVEIKAHPQPGDAEGKSSLFIAQLPEALVGTAVEIAIPSIKIAGERFRLGFSTKSDDHGEAAMPDKVADEAERELYLTPGGIYTQADIEANGTMTASQKFKGFMAKHDMHPKPGDKICPITMTKANPACAWIVAGKKYEFCCPPCVDEFVSWAKNEETIKDIKDPESYVQN
jgi:hypothetical protein